MFVSVFLELLGLLGVILLSGAILLSVSLIGSFLWSIIKAFKPTNKESKK